MYEIGPNQPTPKCLYSAYSKAPFSECTHCSKDLMTTQEPHVVEQVLRQGEVVFEYALCMACLLNEVEHVSRESSLNMARYLDDRPEGVASRSEFDFIGWTKGQLELATPNMNEMASPRCDRCGSQDQNFTEEHTITGCLVGGNLFSPISRYCTQCMEGAIEVLSKPTRDWNEDFIQRMFPTMPSTVDLPSVCIGI